MAPAPCLLCSSSLCWSLLVFLLGCTRSSVATASVDPEHAGAEELHNLGGFLIDPAKEAIIEAETEPVIGILFPIFVCGIGIYAYWIISRFVPWLPYTAVMFLIGTIMAVGTIRLANRNLISESIIAYWININGELLLNIFLPGLIFKDAFNLNVHLFRAAFWQCVTFAFPMVLAGTSLTALVAFYILPYNWPFDLAMTFGSILSATDPVAVAALLEEVGAPPRLKVHVSGEALLNDGSAIVFFTIFSSRYLFQLGVPEFGENIGWKEGVAIFFRMSLGGVAIGIFFALGLLLTLWLLNHRLDREENVVQVAATISIAYLCYFTADVVWGTSGVIATFTLGLLTQFIGRGMFNDYKLNQDFWTLTEHLLNTVLFTLGGLVWGRHISNEGSESFSGQDWGYLFLLYVLVVAIRGLLFVIFYPITKSIGLGTNWRETVFQWHGGLRGAVGISLPTYLQNTVDEALHADPTVDERDEEYVHDTHFVFAFVGGIAFLTLVLNAPTAGPLLRRLGLADSNEVRERIINAVKDQWRRDTIDDMTRLMTQRRFRPVKFSVVREHVHAVKDLTEDELIAAATTYHETHKLEPNYRPPYLKNFFPYLTKDGSAALEKADHENGAKLPEAIQRLMRQSLALQQSLRPMGSELLKRRAAMSPDTPNTLIELRRIFLEVLRSGYEKQIHLGELADREFLVLILLQSISMAADDASHGKPLNDWEYTSIVKPPSYVGKRRRVVPFQLEKCLSCVPESSLMYKRYQIEKALAFIDAHKHARHVMRDEFFSSDLDLTSAEDAILKESKAECNKAIALIQSFDKADVEHIISHKFCTILLNNCVHRIEVLNEAGLLKESEAEEFLEHIQAELLEIVRCKVCMSEGGADSNEEGPESTLDIVKEEEEEEEEMRKEIEAFPDESNTVEFYVNGEQEPVRPMFRHRSIAHF